MNALDPREWTISTLSQALRKKKISPLEVTRAYLDRIETHDSKINSFISLLPRQALQAALQAEKDILKGKYLGPLHGIPFAAKDLFFTKGIRTTCGSKILKDFIPAYSATIINRLYSAGAILLGKLNMHEFAYGITSINSYYGPVRNPWDLERISGGSSGGSAAALAASFAPLTLGTDTGGSIRIPSALCGVVGLKPTYGRISRYGVYPLCWSLDHPGPMATRVADLAIAMKVLAGHDPLDPSTPQVPVPEYPGLLNSDLKGVRLGIPTHFFYDRLDPEVRGAVLKAIGHFKTLRARVGRITIPQLPEASLAAFIILIAEGSASLEKWHRTRYRDLGEDVRGRLNLGAAVMATQYLKAQRFRRKIRENFRKAFEKVDALITPQLPITAPRIDQVSGPWNKKTEPIRSALIRFTQIFNLLGTPALTLPCGFSAAGLPIGLQIVAKPFDEETVLRVAYAYELGTPWKNRHPSLD